MKKIVLTTMAFCLFTLQAVHAQPSCQSLFSNVVRAADGVIQKILDLQQTAADALGPYIVTATTGVPPQFTNTQAARNAISDMADAAIGVQSEILGLIGAVSGDGKGHIGPRYLHIPTKQVTGELIATERTFIVTPSSYDKVIVTIKKRDGKAGADIAICAKWADGREYNTKDQKYFADSESSIGDEQQWVFANMKDKFLTIHLVHTGGLLNYFDYELAIEGEWDAADLYALSNSTQKSKPNKSGFTRPENTPASSTTTKPSKSAGSNTTIPKIDEFSDKIPTTLGESSRGKTTGNNNTTTKPVTTKTVTVPTKSEAASNSSLPEPQKTVPTKSEAAKNSTIKNTATPTTTNNQQISPNNTIKTSPTTVTEERDEREEMRRENKQQNSNKEPRPNKNEAKDRMKDKREENRTEAETNNRKDKTKDRMEEKREQKQGEETEKEKRGNTKEKVWQNRSRN